jgi:quinohemoprotein ethanol dehydrogenase
MKKGLCSLLFFISIMGCQHDRPAGWIDLKRLLNRQAGEWLALGGNHLMQHYSPLDQITPENAKDLGFAWEYDASSVIGRVHRGLEATPIVVDGVMFTSGAWGFVYALDARTGQERWRYSPEVDATYARKACCDVVNRGVAVWEGRVYVGTLDGYLVALDAETGKVLWKKDTFTDRSKSYTITSPPQVAGPIVMIGNSGGEFGVRGYITAYDLKTGEQKWRFFTVPGKPENGFEHPEMEAAAKTWDPQSAWESGGGGTSWGESAYDPELNLLYVGTGNSSPYPIWLRSPAGGDNLYLASILAINPDNGKLVWHYQTTPGEIWDYTATMNIVLADIELAGKPRKVLMQAPKNGFFYVLDRATGELLSAEKYTMANWASHVDLKTGRPVLTGQGWYKDGPRLVAPSLSGGHNWQPMSYNPSTGLVYIPEHTVPLVYEMDSPSYSWKQDQENVGINYNQLMNYSVIKDQVKQATDTISSESLLAWNPVTQKAVWKVSDGAPDGGTLATRSLVFQGTRTGYLKVYDALTGKKLKEIFTGTGIMAAPTTYSLDGEQYVAVMAGYGGAPMCCYPPDAAFHTYENKGRILAFKLGGGTTPLPPRRTVPELTEPAGDTPPEPTQVALGKRLYYNYCETCHGIIGVTTTLHPDLTRLPDATHKAFKDIVWGGLLAKNGMASFRNTLSEKDVEAIHQYLIQAQQDSYKKVSKR